MNKQNDICFSNNLSINEMYNVSHMKLKIINVKCAYAIKSLNCLCTELKSHPQILQLNV